MTILTDISSGSSSSPSTHKSNIFLSFRGVDTRSRFVAHLYKALKEADYNPFLDDEEIETGEPLKPELVSAIKSSRASIIVLSKNYASSTWCLDELVLILEQRRNSNQIVIPVYYDVEPTEVRKQQGSFGQAMAVLKQKMEAETDAEKRRHWAQKMESWKSAVREVAGVKGKGAYGRKEKELIDEIITDVQSRTGRVYLSESLSSSAIHSHKFDVFISFRGCDTGNSFTAYLYAALLDAGFRTFLDDEVIETGEPLKTENAVKSSRASIIVLSTNYASSTFCLNELVLILEQNRNFNQIVIPVFYDVEPTEVRKQQGSFGEAMAAYERLMEAETDAVTKRKRVEKMVSWKSALTEVACLAGTDAKDRLETEVIEEIIEGVTSRLGVPLPTASMSQLIAMKYHIEHITSWLNDGSGHTADILTIWGISGIGKTSLADSVFELHRHEYTSSFVRDISRRCGTKYCGLLDVQKQLYDDISKPSLVQVDEVSVYTSMIEKAVACKRVLLVLDDIDSPNQLDALFGNKGLHLGSKIIITTTDASLIERCALFNPQVQPRHTKVLLNGLYGSASLELLRIHAFKSQKLKGGYKDVSEKLVDYCERHPLAIEVLGRSLHMRDLAYWKGCIRGLKNETHSRIKKALQMSFDSLRSKNDKDLFKHIACFFVGIDRDLAETILNACDINTKSGIANLIDRGLLSVGWKNELMMHSLIQEMGRDLVRQESPDEPWNRSRLWGHEESFEVLKQRGYNKRNLLGLALDMRMLDKTTLPGSFELKTDSLSQMHNLMLLKLNHVQLNGFLEDVPRKLRWMCMHGYPLKSITLDLPLENLVALDMSYSNIESFHISYAERQKHLAESCLKDKPLLGSLKILDLSFCKRLYTLGGFSELPALERLIVRGCISLNEVCESIEQCVKLIHIDLSNCRKLKKLPISIGKLKKVKTLLLNDCNSGELQASHISINSQSSSYAIMETIPSDLKFFTISLPRSLITLSLANSKLSNDSFPKDLSFLSMLEKLCLTKNPIVSMPDCVRSLPRLEELIMNFCDKLVSIEHPPRTLRGLSIMSSYRKASLRRIKFDPEMSSLTLYGDDDLYVNWPLEIDGMLKIQAMTDIEEKVLHRLGWKNLVSIKKMNSGVHNGRSYVPAKTQMCMNSEYSARFTRGKKCQSGLIIEARARQCHLPSHHLLTSSED